MSRIVVDREAVLRWVQSVYLDRALTEFIGAVLDRDDVRLPEPPPDTGQAREPDANPVGGFTHDPSLVALVADQIAVTYSDDDYQIRPDPSDVIADVMATVRADIRDRAEDQARCGKVDECAARALVLARLADWLEGWPPGTVQAPDVAALGTDTTPEAR